MTYFVTTNPASLTRRWITRTQPQADTHPLPVDIRDDGENFTLTAFVPGLKAEDLNIQIIDDSLAIEGKFGNQQGDYLLNELPAGSFRRALRLPTPLDADKAEAALENGILTLRIPRAETARPRSVTIVSK